MFKDLDEVSTESENQKEIGFSLERFEEVSRDFDRFTNELVSEYGIDPENLGRTWSGGREVDLWEVKARYIISTYANLEIRDQLLANKEPKILEVGSYMTGLIPAMYLASKGFKPEVMDISPVKRRFPQLSQIAEERYGVMIHENDIRKLPESFKGSYDMAYVQSFEPSFCDYENEVGKGVSFVLRDNGIFSVNDGGMFDMFRLFDPEFTEEMNFKWRFIAEKLGIGVYENKDYQGTKIAILRKNSELEKAIFYFKKDFGECGWPIARYNFVIRNYSGRRNIDFKKFTRGHIYSLMLFDNHKELPVMDEENFNIYQFRGSCALLQEKTRWVYHRIDYLPTEMSNIILDYNRTLRYFPTRTLEDYISLRAGWLSQLKNPIKDLVASNEQYQEEISYYQDICRKAEDEWIDFVEKIKRDGGTIRR